jgi:ABC-2 type transport system permease protein
MPPLFKLIAVRLKMLGHAVTGLRGGGALKFLVVAGFGLGLVLVLFRVMSLGFRYLRGYPDFQNILMGYLFSVYFLTMLLMLAFSNAVISFGALFRSEETRLLMTLPLESRAVYGYKTGESLLFSSWAFLMLGGPLLAAFGLYGGPDPAHWSFYPAAAALVAPFVLIPAAGGALIGMLLTRFFPRSRGRVLGLGFAVVAGAGMFLTVRAGFFLEGRAGINEAFVEEIFSTFRFSKSPWSPSAWAGEGLLAAYNQEWGAVAFSWGLLATTALFMICLGDFVAEKLYASSYSRSSGSGGRRVYRLGGVLDRVSSRAARWSPITARLVTKDLRSFVRDPVQWSQVAIFFGLLFIYVANLRNLGYQRVVIEHIQSLRWTNFVAFTNLAAAGLTLATLTTRFVFPMVSMEGRRFWVLALLPVRRSRLLLGKYVFATGGSLVLIVPLVFLGSRMLGIPARMAWIHMLAGLCMCAGLPGIAVGMGALFPNYRESSPAKIVSGFGGTLCLVTSIGFVCLLVMGLGWVSASSLGIAGGNVVMARRLWAAMGAAGLASLLFAAVPLIMGCRAINRAEL